ncbi:MAG: nucleotidyltransferase family protein [Pseudomonadota bacterium]
MNASVNALILAGARDSGDPLCESENVKSKAVIDIAGSPMLSYVTRALSGAGIKGPIWILGGEEEDLAKATGHVDHRILPAKGAGPAASLALALKGPVSTPLLVTTADHPLLTVHMLQNFLQQCDDGDADICIGFAQRATIEAEYPSTKRTYLPIGEKDLSGCNLFFLRGEVAIGVLEFWSRVEKHRKQPWRIMRSLGLLFLLRVLLARANTKKVFELLSRRLGAEIKPIILPFAEAAIDVDKLSDLQMVREIFDRRKSHSSTT